MSCLANAESVSCFFVKFLFLVLKKKYEIQSLQGKEVEVS